MLMWNALKIGDLSAEEIALRDQKIWIAEDQDEVLEKVAEAQRQLTEWLISGLEIVENTVKFLRNNTAWSAEAALSFFPQNRSSAAITTNQDLIGTIVDARPASAPPMASVTRAI